MLRQRDARGKGLACLQPVGLVVPQACASPAAAFRAAPSFNFTHSLTKARGGVEPKSHCLPVSHARLKTAVTRTEKAAPAGDLQDPATGTPAPDYTSLDMLQVRAQTSTAHLPEVLGRGLVLRTARSPIGSPIESLLLLTSAR